MLKISGKSIISTDWHFGNKNDSQKFHKILTDSIRNIIKYANENNVDNLIFCGDFFHKRNAISVDTMYVATKCMMSLSKTFKNIYMILGNHDMFNQADADIYSPVIFESMKNVHIISKDEIVDINGYNVLFAPWFSDLSKYKKESFDMIFGHFNISDSYIRACYRENVNKKNIVLEDISIELENEELLQESDLSSLNFENENTEETYVDHKKSSELIGMWVDIVKDGGTIFTGHIHRHKEIYTKGRRFIFIGSPYQQNFSEISSDDGFYVLDYDNTYFFERLSYPEHIEVRISEILNSKNPYDYSKLKGKVVKKIYDTGISNEKDAEITRNVINARPFEEVSPEYNITQNYDSNDLSQDTIDKISKSPLEYLRDYINNMDDSSFDGKYVTRESLFNTAKHFYEISGGDEL